MLAEGESLEVLEGDIRVIQNTKLYRFTSDAILLARFARAKMGDAVADLCAGSGVVGLQFYALHPRCVRSLDFFEMQPALADLCARSVQLNALSARVHCTRVQDIGPAHTEAYSLALCNPPYERGGFTNADPSKALCRSELSLTLAELLDCARRILKFGGRLAIVHRADRIAELLAGMKARSIEPKRLQLVSGRAGGKPYLVLVEGVKGGREGVEVLANSENLF